MNATDAMGDILFFALGVCLFLFGIILAFCRTVRSKRRCRRRVNAVICDVDVSWTDDDFYQYTLDGQEYRVVSRVEYSKKDEIKVGSYEVLFVDEKNPRYFSCPSENRERVISALIWSVLGVAFALFPLVGWGGWIGFLVALGLLLLGDLCYDAWSKNRKE